MKIPLFDVDGTLTMKGNRVHNRALNFAFKTLYGIDGSMDEIAPHGMIESQIIVEVLKLHGLEEDAIRKDLEKIYNAMRVYINKQTDTKYSPKPGAIELLEALKQKGVLIGVLTGNMDAAAKAKLDAAGLWDYVDFGAYGNEGVQRVDLVAVAKKRAEQILGREVPNKDLVIIGDTPKDVICAKSAHIESIAVASGMSTKDDLEKENPDLVISSLEEKDKILSFFEN